MTDGPRLRAASYNIHSLRDDRAALTDTVRAIAPDVLILQEALRWVNPFTWFVDLGRRFGMRPTVAGLRSRGNAILTAPGVSVQRRWLLRYPLAFGHYPRGAVFAHCAAAGGAFLVAGSHLSTHAAMRLRQASIFKAALDKAQAELGVPVLVGVDVNETSTGGAWQVIVEGLVDVAEAAGQADVPTYPTGGAFERIDALFTAARYSLLDYRVVDGPLARAASDHFPVLAEVMLPVP